MNSKGLASEIIKDMLNEKSTILMELVYCIIHK